MSCSEDDVGSLEAVTHGMPDSADADCFGPGLTIRLNHEENPIYAMSLPIEVLANLDPYFLALRGERAAVRKLIERVYGCK